jgi:hypothetical protein
MAMNTNQKLYTAGAVLVVLLGALLILQRRSKREDAIHTINATQATLPEIKLAAEDVDKVTKIQITNAAKSDVVLEKTGDTWKLVKPLAFAANQQNVKSLLDNLKEIKVRDVIDTGKGYYGAYELEGDKPVHLVVYKGADKAIDAYFGKSGSRGQMTRVADKDGVWVSNGYSSYLYTRELKDWRDRDILKFEDANVVSVMLENKNGKFSFSKNGDNWSATLKGKSIDRFDSEKIKDLLRAYKALSAEDFADDKSPADTGLDKPEATVQFTLKDNAGSPKVLVGKVSTGTSHYARRDGTPTIFTLSSWTSDWAAAEVSKFQKAGDAGAPKPPDKPKPPEKKK